MTDKTLQELREEKADLLAQIESMQHRVKDLSKLIAHYELKPPADVPPGSNDAVKTQSFPNAVRSFLQRNPGKFFAPHEISKAAAQARAIPETRNFYVSIFNACRRLADAEEITEGQKEGGKAYKLKT